LLRTFFAASCLAFEALFHKQGYSERADAVFVAERRRVRRRLARWSPAWLANWLLDFLVLYGRVPERAFLLGIPFVLLGLVLFWNECTMQRRSEGESVQTYSCFWFSVDAFLPAVDLGMAKQWLPRQDRWFACNYMRVMHIAGWILVPVGLAALTGLVG
jgi:hypothetical protein